jgi:hypothetical protein
MADIVHAKFIIAGKFSKNHQIETESLINLLYVFWDFDILRKYSHSISPHDRSRLIHN